MGRRNSTGRAWLVAGLGFGDEGKGATVDWLVRETGARWVVRYNGGPQAAHHVSVDGRVHCFAQFGAGTLVGQTRTWLSRFMLVDPLAMEAERDALVVRGVGEPMARLVVDPRCVVVTPYHWLMNRLREQARGDARHGTCGRGAGEARLDAETGAAPTVMVADCLDPGRLRGLLVRLHERKLSQARACLADSSSDAKARRASLEDLADPGRLAPLVQRYTEWAHGLQLSETLPVSARDGDVVFEGAQGVLLDREAGFWPHVTPSTTTFAGAEALLDEVGWVGDRHRLGVTRSYATRHGAGPLLTQDDGLWPRLPEPDNGSDGWQEGFRVGWLDTCALRYAVEVCGGLDGLALTHVDRLAVLPALRLGEMYMQDGGPVRTIPTMPRGARARWWQTCEPRYVTCSDEADFMARLEALVGVPILATARGPSSRDRVWTTPSAAGTG